MENVLITGGTSGIGYALARIFAANKYNLILVSSNYENLKIASQKLQTEFLITINIFEQDLSELRAAEKLYTRLQAENINVDILVNNAGCGLPKTAMSADEVAEYAYRQLMKNKSVFIPGFINRVMQAFPTDIKMLAVAEMKKD